MEVFPVYGAEAAGVLPVIFEVPRHLHPLVSRGRTLNVVPRQCFPDCTADLGDDLANRCVVDPKYVFQHTKIDRCTNVISFAIHNIILGMRAENKSG
jgi:hypothetical protein